MEMFDDHGFPKFETNDFPLAYLITFRTYGSWHHGDDRQSVGRNNMNIYGGPKFQPSVPFTESMSEKQNGASIILNESQRSIVSATIDEVCIYRDYFLQAQNVRTNHAHCVVSASVKPEKIANDFKAYATRRLREANVFRSQDRVWSRGSSARYLWKPRHVGAAVEYVLYSQGDIPFEMD